MQDHLLVFVSSIMDRSKDDLSAERDAAKAAVMSVPLSRPWRFEDSPASSELVAASYLDRVRECDIFVLILGKELTLPVREEYDTARQNNKPCLVFLRRDEPRSPSLQAFIDNIDVKWKKFDDATELREEVVHALLDELVRDYRRYQLLRSDVRQLRRKAFQLTIISSLHTELLVVILLALTAIAVGLVAAYLLRWLEIPYAPSAVALTLLLLLPLALSLRVLTSRAINQAGQLEYTYAKWRPAAKLALLSALVVLPIELAVHLRLNHRYYFPPEFRPEAYGIIVATFGELQADDTMRRPSQHSIGHLVSAEVANQLQKELGDSGLANIEVVTAGPIGDAKRAQEVGNHAQARIVVWGWVEIGKGRAVTAHFRLIETPEMLASPGYTRVLPIGYALTDDVQRRVPGPDSIHISEELSSAAQVVAWFSQSLVHYYELNYIQAQHLLEKAIAEIDASSGESEQANIGLMYYYLGRSYVHLAKLDKAISSLSEAQRSNPSDPGAAYSLAAIYQNLGMREESRAEAEKAVQLCKDAIARSPCNTHAHYDLGLVYELLGDLDSALRHYLESTSCTPSFSIGYIGAGRVYQMQQQYAQAVEVFKQAIKTRPEKCWPYLHLGFLYELLGDSDLAQENLNKALERAPMESALHYSFALFYEQKGLMERAESEFQMVVDYSHNPGWARNEMGDFYRRTERHSLAIDQYQRSLAQRPDDPSTQYNLAMAFHSDGQLEHAIAAMERAIGLRPDRSMWHGTLGNFLFSVGRMDDAVRAYEQAILLDPNLIQAHCNLARAYEGAGRVCEAVDEYLLCASETESQDQREYARSRAEELECRP